MSRMSDVLYFYLLVVKKPAVAEKAVGKSKEESKAKKKDKKPVPASRSKSGIFIHCLYLKCMQTSD